MGKTKTKVIDDSSPVKAPPHKEKTFRMEKPARPQEEPKKEFKIERPKKEPPTETREKQVKEAGREKKLATEKEKIPTPQKVRSKKYQARLKLVDRGKFYPLAEAVELIKKTSYTTFNGSIEAHINTDSQNLRGLVSLPYLSGKRLTILAFGPSTTSTGSTTLTTSSLGTGALGINPGEEKDGVTLGNDAVIEQIAQGRVNFNVVIATAEWMPKLATVAKILGPKGLMPNSKNNTLTEDLKKTVSELKTGKIEYKTEPNGQVIHLMVGRVDQPSDQIQANIKTLLRTIGQSKIKKVTLSATMGPGVKVGLGTIPRGQSQRKGP